MKSRQSGIYISATLGAIGLCSGAAHAQTQDVPATATPAARPAAAAVSVTNSEIVVTAERRSETLKSVPISISIVQPKQIEQLSLRTLQDAQVLSPGLTFNTSFGFFQTFIRGVGTSYSEPGLESAVATYIDGAYLPRGEGAIFDLLDVASVQVLKGPQGTLYGRNATGGAILLTTADPTDRFEGHVSGEYGRFDHKQVEAVVNVPLNDAFSVRLAARYLDEGGYIRNLFDNRELGGRRAYTIRGKIAFRPSPDFSAVLSVQHDDNRIHGRPTAERLPTNLCLGCTVVPGSGPALGFYQVNNNYDPDVTSKATNINLKVEAHAGIFNITNVLAYRKQNEFNPSDQDYTGAPLFNYDNRNGGKSFTEDLSISTNSHSWIDALAGFSYLHDNGFYQLDVSGTAFEPLLISTGALPDERNVVTTQSAAVFGEIYITPIKHLKFTVGGRYTHDSRDLRVTSNLAANLGFGGAPGILSFNQRASFDAFTPRFVVNYDAGRANIYASYTKGFKAGGFVVPTAIARDRVEPETIESYEIGVKYASANGRLRANLAAFRYDYRNVQVTIIDVSTGGSITTNAAKARGKGLEADVDYRPTRWLDLFAGGAYLRARYTDYPLAIAAGPGPIDPVSGLPDGLVSTTQVLTGSRLPRAPKYTAYAGANLNMPIGDWKAGLSGVVRYTSSYDFVAGAGGPLKFDQQGRYAVVNLSGTIGPGSDRYQFGFYVENLTSTHYAENRATSAPFAAEEEVARPRSYGLRVRYNF